MNIALLLAAGKSRRAGLNKLWATVQGRPLWTLAYEKLAQHPEIDELVVLVPKGEEANFQKWMNKGRCIAGGESRLNSFEEAIRTISWTETDLILEHNAASPHLTEREISEVLSSAREWGASAVSLPVVDTLARVDDGLYTTYYPREALRLLQTPQAVRGDILKRALNSPFSTEATDLSSLISAVHPVRMLEANPLNRKITFAEEVHALSATSLIAQDEHAFSDQGSLILGGLKINDLPALQANSDGDAVLHAIGRALAQAKNSSFSETADELCKQGIKDSSVYIQSLLKDLTLHHVSIHIEAARPKIDPIQTALKNSLAGILSIKPEQISISASSGESLTPWGRGEGIRCICVLTASTKIQ